MSRAYTTLITRLHDSTPALPLETIASALAFHLSDSNPPTQLAATAVSAPLFLALSLDRLSALHTSFRHAVQLKYQNMHKDPSRSSSGIIHNILTPSTKTRLSEWVVFVIQGLQGGAPPLRLMCLSGLVSGLEDVKVHVRNRNGADSDPPVRESALSQVQRDLVLSLAELIDVHSGSEPNLFAKGRDVELPTNDNLSNCIALSAPSLLLLTKTKFATLPLPHILRIVMLTVGRIFRPISGGSALSDPLFEYLAPAARLASYIISLQLSMNNARHVLQNSGSVVSYLDSISSSLEVPANGAADTDALKDQWIAVKTFLFTVLMITEGVLGSVIYLSPDVYSSPSVETPKQLALSTLRILLRLSAPISQLGGLSAASTNESGFRELKRTFYLAIDILCSSDDQGKDIVPELTEDLCRTGLASEDKMAFGLNTIEFLCPSLLESARGRAVMSADVWTLCSPNLWSPEKSLELFESAHSVILSMFAADAKRRLESSTEDFPFARKLVPFYSQCLIENSAEGRLSTPQLTLAYSSLTRCAAASTRIGSSKSFETDHLLPWFTIEKLLEATESYSWDTERLHRLRLTLISTVSCLPRPLMLNVLNAAGEFINDTSRMDDMEKRKELVEALHSQILDKVGDLEKEVAVRWWTDNMDRTGSPRKKRAAEELVARL